MIIMDRERQRAQAIRMSNGKKIMITAQRITIVSQAWRERIVRVVTLLIRIAGDISIDIQASTPCSKAVQLWIMTTQEIARSIEPRVRNWESNNLQQQEALRLLRTLIITHRSKSNQPNSSNQSTRVTRSQRRRKQRRNKVQ